MASLAKELRKQLESAVRKARRASEAGAKKALEGLAVAHHEPWPSMSKAERDLRNRLRAHGRQLGDKLDEKRGTQSVNRLATEVGYEQWHRMLFARFLAECDLLIEPDSGVAVSIDEVRELAREKNEDWIELASGWAQRMLPQIFRSGDPVLEVALPPEARQELELLLEALPREVFVADDSLGWCYQFWQADRKDEVNASGVKIGADELPAVTQLFTEDYMVDFLLDNTLGAWWAGKKLSEGPKLATEAENEEELRRAVALPGAPWSYLRFVRGDDGRWTPAAGTFYGWPKTAKGITCLDPCMGSGHFIVAMFQRIVAMRMAEEGLDEKSAVSAVIAENIYGLEIDPQCTQIAAFNLAVAAWRQRGNFVLPEMNLACSGLGINAKEEEWIALAAEDGKAREAMKHLYSLFEQAPILGSLIDPTRLGEDLFTASYDDIGSLIEQQIQEEQQGSVDLAVAAKGIIGATSILAKRFVLVATNVPYLGRAKQAKVLQEHCEVRYPTSKADLATCFLERSEILCVSAGTVALVSPHSWLYLTRYEPLRRSQLSSNRFNFAVRLGTGAFTTISGEVVNASLVAITREKPSEGEIASLDVSAEPSPTAKSVAIRRSNSSMSRQQDVVLNPNAQFVFSQQSVASDIKRLEHYAECYQGLRTGDANRFIRQFFELPAFAQGWDPYQFSDDGDGQIISGLTGAILWEGGKGKLSAYAAETREKLHDMHESGNRCWTRKGVAIGQMTLRATLYLGDKFDNTLAVIVPKDESDLGAVLQYCSSPEYSEEVRRLAHGLYVTNRTLLQVPFDAQRWRGSKAESSYPLHDVKDVRQWLFSGHPATAEEPLHVAAARVLAFLWPRQRGSFFPQCPSLGPDGLERHADHDGIVSLTAVKGEGNAADRLRALLADAYGAGWSPAKLNEQLARVGYAGKSLEEWLRDGFFEKHCDLFHQRPFIWQIWDGVRNGFSALVNYHKLAAPNGEGRKTLEKLIYSYLGDWIERQRKEQKSGVEGADLRLAAAEHLKSELEKILHGEPPYDIFVRWKPLHEQPIGWDPDINDGVRINIRPFMTAKPLNARGKNACILRSTPNIKWGKDRGNEPNRPKDDYPWFWGRDENTPDFTGGRTFDGNRWNDLHYTRAFKEAARKRHKEEKR